MEPRRFSTRLPALGDKLVQRALSYRVRPAERAVNELRVRVRLLQPNCLGQWCQHDEAIMTCRRLPLHLEALVDGLEAVWEAEGVRSEHTAHTGPNIEAVRRARQSKHGRGGMSELDTLHKGSVSADGDVRGAHSLCGRRCLHAAFCAANGC